MEKLAGKIVRKRHIVLAVFLILSVISGILSFLVPINTDMTKYLPDDSSMKQGTDLLSKEFGGLSMPATLRVMFENLPEEAETSVRERLSALPSAATVVKTGRKTENGRSYTLYTITMNCDYRTKEALALESAIPRTFPEYQLTVRNDDKNGMEIPLFVYGIALAVLLTVLLLLCSSFFEPLVFLFTIGVAILLNMGTNLLLGSVSATTHSMSAILQLVLSMDYSIILMNRFRQEKTGEKDLTRAMENALIKAFPSIASSGFTTIVGLTMLVFMRFRIGMDIGLVLAKGVFLSMLCCVTMLPALILMCHKLIERTEKKPLRIKTGALARFSYRARYALAAVFVVLFFGSWYLSTLAEVSFSLNQEDPIVEIFQEENQIVLLYENQDEEAAAEIARETEDLPDVNAVMTWSTTLGKKMGPDEMTSYLEEMLSDSGTYGAMFGDLMEGLDFSRFQNQLNENTMRSLYSLYGLLGGEGAVDTLSLEQLISFLKNAASNPLLASLMGEDAADMAGRLDLVLEAARAQLVGPSHSLMMISTFLPVESEETSAFITSLQAKLSSSMTGQTYLIGNSIMSQEMKQSFSRELLTITLLSAAAIFIVVFISFRSAAVATILISLVQCGVFMAIFTAELLGYHMHYLAVLIVQCVLMGATVDYGILFTNYYRENRRVRGIPQALEVAYDQSIHTILTSSLFMILGTGAIALSPADPTIAQICQSISIGATAASLLVIFVLPGLLAALDRFVNRR